MPVYEYVCENKHQYSEQRSIHEERVVFDCPECGEKLKQKYYPTPVKFNATGFYRTGG